MITAPARDPLADRRRALAWLAGTGREVAATPIPFLAQVGLRVDPALAARLGIPLPVDPNTARVEGTRTALWLGPDEWLIVAPPGTGADLAASLDGALAGHHRSVLDLSANRVAVRLTGPGRFALLDRGCSLDLHPRSWRAGMSAQTLLGRTQAILWEQGDATTVLVRASFAHYLVDWLLAAVTHPDG